MVRNNSFQDYLRQRMRLKGTPFPRSVKGEKIAISAFIHFPLIARLEMYYHLQLRLKKCQVVPQLT